MMSDFCVQLIGSLKNQINKNMIGKFSAIVGAIGFIVYLSSIVHSVLKSSIISFSASLPVLIVVSVGIVMMAYDFVRMLSLSDNNKSKNRR